MFFFFLEITVTPNVNYSFKVEKWRKHGADLPHDHKESAVANDAVFKPEQGSCSKP